MKKLFVAIFLSLLLFGNSVVISVFAVTAFAAPLEWQVDKNTAVSLAESEGKKILLLAGRDACGNTVYMKETVVESASPPIKSLIEQYFILWYCDVDLDNEWETYTGGLPDTFTLPLICCIDPSDSNHYLDRTTSIQSPDEFYALLNKVILEDDVEDIEERRSGCFILKAMGR